MKSNVPEKVKERYEKLKTSINHYRHLYHVENKEEISPEALDSLKAELVTLESEYPTLITPDSPSQRVAGAPLAKFEKVVHKVPQWSLNDAFDESEIREFDARVRRMLKSETGKDTMPAYMCELKIDGLHTVLEYKKGKLDTAATRGDGSVGENVTHNIRTIDSVPLTLQEPVDVIVEGEVWLPKDQLEKINAERTKNGEEVYANPRNLAAGTIRQLDPKITAQRKLDTFIYDISLGETPASQEAELLRLRNLGFKVNPHFKLCKELKR
jgi:DNA ligase (NAD+)